MTPPDRKPSASRVAKSASSGWLQQDRPAEDAVVELSRPLDVGDGEPDVRDG